MRDVEARLCYEDVSVGDPMPDLVKEISTVSMVRYAAATWDFHRYHHDRQYANDRGMREEFLDGQQMGGYLAQHVVDWAGLDATLKRLSFRYGDFVFPGDTLTCKRPGVGQAHRRRCGVRALGREPARDPGAQEWPRTGPASQ